MIRFKTNEEYILNELFKTQVELQLANKKIEELEEILKNNDTSEENMNCIYLSDKPNYWYSFNIQSTWKWNKILEDNNKTPKLVEKALSDDKALKQLCNLKENDGWRSELGYVDERTYNYLFKGRNGLYSVIETGREYTNFYNIKSSDECFLNKEEAEIQFKEKMIKEINYYLKNYKDKFKEESNE